MSQEIVPKDSPERLETPLVSIIIPVYNQEDCLGPCLDSILAQEFSAFEIIVVNDASTDYTKEVCELYAAKDTRIHILTNEQNKGQGYSRNLALKLARASYISYVDSDDYIAPLLLVRGVDILNNSEDTDIVIFDRHDVDMQGNVVTSQSFEQGLYKGQDVFRDFCLGKVRSYGPVAKIYRKSMLDKHQLEFPEYMWEDNFFALKAYYYARNIYFTAEHGYTRVFMPHPASAMTPLKFTPRHISGICSLVADIHTFFAEIATEQEEIYAKSFEQNFFKRFRSFFAYMAKCYHNNFTPITHDNLQNLLQAKFFLSILLEKYALLHATRIGFGDKTQSSTQVHSFLRSVYENVQQKVSPLSDEILYILTHQQDVLEQLIKDFVLLVDKLQKTQQKSFAEQALVLYRQTSKVTLFFKSLQNLVPRYMFKSIVKNNFALVINIYEKTNYEKTLQFISKQILPARILADAYTTLSKHIQSYDVQGATELAFLAYKADPRLFRLKWLDFRCREAEDVKQVSIIFELLSIGLNK